MKRTTLASLVAAPLLALAFALPAAADTAPAAAPTTCKDGTTSNATGRGACSGHGGVQKNSGASSSTSSSAASAPAATPPPATTPPSGSASSQTSPATTKSSSAASSSSSKPASGNTDPTGATAKCKDGTYSKSKSHSGACSHHGGVDQWLNSSQ